MYLLSQQLFGRLQRLLHHLNESFVTGGVAFHLHDKSIPTQPLTRNILSSLICEDVTNHKSLLPSQNIVQISIVRKIFFTIASHLMGHQREICLQTEKKKKIQMMLNIYVSNYLANFPNC